MTHSPASTTAKVQFSQPSSSPTEAFESKLHSLAVLWARKYYLSVSSANDDRSISGDESAIEVDSLPGRARTAEKLLQNLTLASAQAWSFTETLLSEEIRRHGINPELINPLQIAADTRHLFEKALDGYANGFPPARLSVILGRYCGKVRQKYTAEDPRAIGFVSMQFHYTGQKLLEWLSPSEKELFAPYLKVMDDHMYMPLQASYEAAANHDEHSPVLIAVQKLLPISTRIAHAVYDRVSRQHPSYHSYSGALTQEIVKISSIRDVEMFQVYLCLCVLEASIGSVQQELFPLCVMLYPRLQVSWTLVQEMLQGIFWEMHGQLPLEYVAIFLPYLRTLSEMFSQSVFRDK